MKQKGRDTIKVKNFCELFKMPTPMKITGRSSSITNAFVNSIIPAIQPNAKEIQQALNTLGMTHKTVQCAYCGDNASEWDHLRPLVKNKKPTGYISETHNLVPSCGKCNQSKGNKEWKTWMLSTVKLSPTTRKIKNISERIKRLETYEKSKSPTKMDFAAVVGDDVWAQHQNNLERVQSLLRESQKLAAKINTAVAKAYTKLSY
jgi:5-methylcytosine-specific restriction endonuclease McrA